MGVASPPLNSSSDFLVRVRVRIRIMVMVRVKIRVRVRVKIRVRVRASFRVFSYSVEQMEEILMNEDDKNMASMKNIHVYSRGFQSMLQVVVLSKDWVEFEVEPPLNGGDPRDGSSDSDSSAILNEDNSLSSVVFHHQLLVSPPSSLRFTCSSTSSIHYLQFMESKPISPGTTHKSYQPPPHQHLKMEEHNFFGFGNPYILHLLKIESLYTVANSKSEIQDKEGISPALQFKDGRTDILSAGTCPVRIHVLQPLAKACGGFLVLHDDFGEAFGVKVKAPEDSFMEWDSEHIASTEQHLPSFQRQSSDACGESKVADIVKRLTLASTTTFLSSCNEIDQEHPVTLIPNEDGLQKCALTQAVIQDSVNKQARNENYLEAHTRSLNAALDSRGLPLLNEDFQTHAALDSLGLPLLNEDFQTHAQLLDATKDTFQTHAQLLDATKDTGLVDHLSSQGAYPNNITSFENNEETGLFDHLTSKDAYPNNISSEDNEWMVTVDHPTRAHNEQKEYPSLPSVSACDGHTEHYSMSFTTDHSGKAEHHFEPSTSKHTHETHCWLFDFTARSICMVSVVQHKLSHTDVVICALGSSVPRNCSIVAVDVRSVELLFLRLRYRPNPDMLINKSNKESKDGDDVYRPPRFEPTAMDEDKVSKQEKMVLRKDKYMLRIAKLSAYVKELMEELEGKPEEIRETIGAESRELSSYKAKIEECARQKENLFTRAPLSRIEKKKETHLLKSRNGLLWLIDGFEDEIRTLGFEEDEHSTGINSASSRGKKFNKHKRKTKR